MLVRITESQDHTVQQPQKTVASRQFSNHSVIKF